MTENKRFVNENDGDIRDTSTMIIYYCLSLTGKELCDLLNEQEEIITEQKEYLTRLDQGKHLKTIIEQKRRIKK